MELKGEQISLVQLAAVAVGGEAVQISPVARPRILASRKAIEQIVERDALVYGVNTGFGKLSDVRIPQLEAKEGLALLNGTQAMHAAGGLALLRAIRLARIADVAGAMSLEALKGTPAAFDSRLQDARPHPGQKTVAEHLLSLMEASEIRQSHIEGDPRVQDAYSLRCMPQVHGAVRGALTHCEDVLLIESASATDNPLVFAESGEVISGGNFHGAPLALAFD